MHYAKFDVPRHLNEKHKRKGFRYGKRKATLLRRAAESQSRKIEKFGTRSRIIKMISENASFLIPLKGTRLKAKMPASFSIIDNPEAVLQTMSALAKTQRSSRVSSFFIDFKDVREHDLGAHTLLDVVVDEIHFEASLHKKKLDWRGSYPANSSIRRLMKSLGIIRQLKVQHEYPDPVEAAKLTIFDHRCKHYTKDLRPEKINNKGLVAAKFADHINACLGKVNKALNYQARAVLCSYLGEIIENAEAHAGMVDWMVHGYLDASLPVPMCEIVILNFGKSFSQTLEELTSDSFTKQQIEPYISAHSDKKWFGSSWRREDLLTLVALQGNVSSRNTDQDCTRGQGTADLVQFFQKVHEECSVDDSIAKMTIVSGSTRIIFDGRYKMSLDPKGTRVIAFNERNDLKEKPDSKCVMPLKGAYLPGTVIGIQFPLAVTSLSELKEVRNG